MEQEIQDRLARFVSVAFHPIIAPWYMGAFLLYLAGLSLQQSAFWIGLFGAVAILPIMTYTYFSPEHTIFKRNSQKARNKLYAFAFGEVIVLGLMSYYLNPPALIGASYAACVLTLFTGGLVNRFYTKISIHVGVVTAFTVAIAYLTLPLGLIGLVIPPMVAWARLVEKKHDMVQVVLGFIVPAVFILACYRLLL